MKTDYKNKLRDARIAAGLSQVALSAKSGVCLSTLNRLERWPFRASPTVAVKLANALKVDPLDVFPYYNGIELPAV